MDSENSTLTQSDINPPRPYICGHCHKQGHAASRCPSMEIKYMDCGVCKEPCHDIQKCPSIIERRKKGIQAPHRHTGKALTEPEIEMILWVYYMVAAEKDAKRITTGNPFERTVLYTGVSRRKVDEIVKSFKENSKIYHRKDERGSYIRSITLHSPKRWTELIEEIVDRRNQEGKSVTVAKIQDELKEDMQKAGVSFSRQTLTKLLKKMGYTFENVRRAQNFDLTPEIQTWRRMYLRHRLKVSKEQPNTLCLYLDETYCNQYYTSNKSWFRAGDLVRRGNRGRRWVIVHCGGEEGWIGKPLIFEANSRLGDYHQNMNATTFEKYFEELCESTKAHLVKTNQEGRPVIFYIDNAAYHKRIEGREGGIHKMIKEELIKWMKKCGATNAELTIKANKKTPKYKTKIELLSLCKQSPLRFKGKPVVETIAEKAGFRIIWLPPYHPIFNPIEEGWGITKGYVAGENNGKDFNHVKELVLKGFEKVTVETWKDLVRRSHEREQKMIKELNINISNELEDDSCIVVLRDVEEEEEAEEEEDLQELREEDIFGPNDEEE